MVPEQKDINGLMYRHNLVPQVISVNKAPMTSTLIITPVVAFSGKINPFWVTELEGNCTINQRHHHKFYKQIEIQCRCPFMQVKSLTITL
jgi:hypothetical protein